MHCVTLIKNKVIMSNEVKTDVNSFSGWNKIKMLNNL